MIVAARTPTFATPAATFGPTNTEWGSSRWATYQRCHQEHHLRHRLRVIPQRLETDYSEDAHNSAPDGLHFEVGQLVHAGIAWMSDGARCGITRDWRDVVAAASAAHPDWDLGSIYEGERLLGAYFAHWGTDNGGWPEEAEVLEVEHYLEDGRIVDGACVGGTFGMPYTSRADAILSLHDEIVIVDHKTRAQKVPGAEYAKDGTFSVDSLRREAYVRGLATRPQFLGMSWLVMRSMRLEDPPPVLVNAIVKTKIPRFERVMVRFTRAQVEAWVGQQQAIAAEGIASRTMNYTQCAPEIGSRCSYFDWCHGSQEIRERKFRQESQ